MKAITMQLLDPDSTVVDGVFSKI